MTPRILTLTPGEIFGGVERQILDVCAGSSCVSHLDYEPYLFHDAKLAALLRQAGTDPVVVPVRHKYDPSAAAFIADHAASKAHDVIHAHGYRAMVSLGVASLQGRKLPPVVKTEHGLPEPIRGRPVEEARSQLNHFLDRWATCRLKTTVCYVTKDIRHRFDKPHRGLHRYVVYNGIAPLDRSMFARPEDLPRGAMTIGLVGRVSEVKGIDDVLKALAQDTMPPEVHFVVLGVGPLLEDLKQEAAVLGFADRMSFLGFRDNIYDYLAHIDALLMPSLHEGLPYTLLEAMSMGLPVLASRVGGLEEVLEDGVTGLLFPPRSPASIAEACRCIAGDREFAAGLGAQAALVQRQSYTLESMLKQYANVYAEAMDRAL